MTAPGNGVRASMIGYSASPVKAVAQALYYGAALIGEYARLPVIAVSLLALPTMTRAAKQSRFTFQHPWLALLAAYLLYCTQLAPPLYSIASLGDGRIVNTYHLSFLALWFACLYYLAGYAVRKLAKPEGVPAELCAKAKRGLALTAACLMLVGCLAFKRPNDRLYGVQNLSGASAALSIVTGEAKQYDREMRAREALLHDETKPVVTLSPLTAVPSVFMEDLLFPNATYDPRPALCTYYGKEAIFIEGSEDAP